jgi:murein DD-endopeptidase MepM/ murein hydrolase activator NlpD
MNLILFSQSSRAAQRVNLSVPLITASAFFLLALILGAYGMGYSLAGDDNGYRPVAEIDQLRQALQTERQQIAALRQAAQGKINALTLRMGQLNANVIRLNALGGRLTGMAGLEEGEFDFANAPALGGPEEPELVAKAGQLPDLIADIDALDETLYQQQQQLTTLETLLLRRKLDKRVYPQGRPVRSGYISSYFGSRTDPFTGKTTSHRGVDFAGKAGTEVISVAAGVVVWSGDRYGYGQMVEINHGNGYVTRYAHNQQNLVAVGDYVRPGQTIALLGATGRATGPNLHFEVWHRGRPVNPVKHIQHTT